jgi:Xaa-Pro aminopeptidase
MTAPSFDHAARMERARRAMASAGVEALLLSVGPDLPYLTGYAAMPLERLTMLVLTPDDAVLVVPALEAPRVEPGPFDVRAWTETQDPVGWVVDVAGDPARAAVGDHTWSTFLLALQERMPGTEFARASQVMGPLRLLKDPAEIDCLRRAAHATDRVVARLAGAAWSGLTERQMARRVAEWVVEEGHDAPAFAIVASGPNGASPHHEPADRVIGPGDMVVVDFGGTVAGYHSDVTRTFSVGRPTDEQAAVHAAVLQANAAAHRAARPGIGAGDVDAAARRVIDEHGFGEWFIHRTGHGIGLEPHEDPYLVDGNDARLEAGMAFSIEPGIYLPDRFGVRIEDIVVVGDEGLESLNQADRSLTIVE